MKNQLKILLLAAITMLLALSLMSCSFGQTPDCKHTDSEWVITQKATCTENGIKELRCKNDNTVQKTEPIEQLGHNYVSTSTATCDNDGVATFICQNDSTHTYTENAVALGHSFLITTEHAACEEDGVVFYECSHDARHNYQEAIPALGHSYQEQITPAGCDDGEIVYTCENNPNHTYQETIDGLGHDYVVTTTPATCGVDGLISYVCSRNENHFYDEHLPALSHNYVNTKTEATCTEDGENTNICSHDPTHIETFIIPKLEHKYGATTIKATCEEDGNKVYVCANNIAHTYEEILPKLGHDYISYERNPKCEEDGATVFTCKNDQTHTYETPIEKTGHNYSHTSTTEPTCEQAGSKRYTCSYDPSHAYDVPLEALGHDFGEWEHSSDAASYAPASQKRVCANNASHSQTRHYAPTIELGKATDTLTVDSDGLWFMLTLEKTTTVQLTYLQEERQSSSAHIYVNLYSQSDTNNPVLGLYQTGLDTLDEGVYFARIYSYYIAHDVKLCIDDFGTQTKNTPTIELDKRTDDVIVDGKGTWFSLHLSKKTLLQFTPESVLSGFDVRVFDPSDLSEILFGLSVSQTVLKSLDAGSYYIKMFDTSGGKNTGSLLVSNMSEFLTTVPEVSLNESTPTAQIDAQGTWYKLTLDKQHNIRFMFEAAGNGSLRARIHANDGDYTEVIMHYTNGGAEHTATIEAGEYFMHLSLNGSTPVQGSVLIKDLKNDLENATEYTLNTNSGELNVTKEGKWYKFSLQEAIPVQLIKTKIGNSIGVAIYKSNDLYKGLLYSAYEITILEAGDYYIFVYSYAATASGSFELNDHTQVLEELPLITLGQEVTDIEVAVIGESLWYKLVLTEETYITIRVTQTIGNMGAGIYAENDLTNIIRYGTYIGDTLSAGTYYIYISAGGGSEGDIHTGSFIVQ